MNEVGVRTVVKHGNMSWLEVGGLHAYTAFSAAHHKYTPGTAHYRPKYATLAMAGVLLWHQFGRSSIDSLMKLINTIIIYCCKVYLNISFTVCFVCVLFGYFQTQNATVPYSRRKYVDVVLGHDPRAYHQHFERLIAIN